MKWPQQVVLNEKNGFVESLEDLPLLKKAYTFDQEGRLQAEVYDYSYEVEEDVSAGYTSKIMKLDRDGLKGFAFKVENTEKPSTPPDNPPDRPNTPPDIPGISLSVKAVPKTGAPNDCHRRYWLAA